MQLSGSLFGFWGICKGLPYKLSSVFQDDWRDTAAAEGVAGGWASLKLYSSAETCKKRKRLKTLLIKTNLNNYMTWNMPLLIHLVLISCDFRHGYCFPIYFGCMPTSVSRQWLRLSNWTAKGFIRLLPSHLAPNLFSLPPPVVCYSTPAYNILSYQFHKMHGPIG